MKYKYFFLTLGIMFCLTGCGNRSNSNLADKSSGDINAYESSSVNPIEQARPTIMVIPSDILMKRYGALKKQKIDGVNTIIYNYNKYLIANNDNKFLLSLIADSFGDQNYPIQDFEQTFKQLENKFDYNRVVVALI